MLCNLHNIHVLGREYRILIIACVHCGRQIPKPTYSGFAPKVLTLSREDYCGLFHGSVAYLQGLRLEVPPRICAAPFALCTLRTWLAIPVLAPTLPARRRPSFDRAAASPVIDFKRPDLTFLAFLVKVAAIQCQK